MIETTLGVDNSTVGNKSYGQAIDKINGDVLDLYSWIEDIYGWLGQAFNQIESLQNKTEGFNSQAELISNVKADIKENGLFLGERWWIGQ